MLRNGLGLEARVFALISLLYPSPCSYQGRDWCFSDPVCVKTTQPKGVGPRAMESCWTQCAGPECTLATPPVPL